MDTRDKHNTDGPLFTRSEKIMLALFSPLWVPVVFSASVLFLPVGIGMFIKESMKARQKRQDYMSDKAAFMRSWTQEIINNIFSRDNVKYFIENTYLTLFKHSIVQLCHDHIPKQIAADRQQVNSITSDRRTSQEILNSFRPLQRKVREMLAKLLLFQLEYTAKDVIDVSCLEQHGLIGGGNFSTVYRATWTQENGAIQNVALKALKRKPSGSEIYTQLEEVKSLRQLKHTNIVEYLGVCHSVGCQGNEAFQPWSTSLMIVFELCDCSLRQLVFDNQQLHCSSYSSVPERRNTFTFYIQMATDICKGLHFIHSNKYLHRDLKLQNVLFKDGVAKLCDFGFARMESISSGMAEGTFIYMSPELLEGKRYSYSHDVYGLSILLWELWYGCEVYSGKEYDTTEGYQLQDAIITGERPKFTTRYAPVDRLKQLIQQCWNGKPGERPDAKNVLDNLNALYRNHHDTDIDKQERIVKLVGGRVLVNGEEIKAGVRL